MRGRIYGLAVMAASLALGACGDSSISSTKTADAACTGFGGCTETPDAGGGSGGTGGTGGEAPPGEECLDDSGCDASQYCEKSPDALEGVCTVGCRETTCGAGQACDPGTHDCYCTDDTGCDPGQYCDIGAKACTTGCRPDDASSCPDGETCNPETRVCAGPPEEFACCAADGTTCSLATDAASCEGTFLPAVASCEPNPCGPTCGADGECAADRYCSDAGICIEGCRLEPNDNCPDGTYCDPAKNTCEADVEMPCQSSAECVEGEFCNPNTGECEPGCDPGVAGECGPGEVCGADNACTPGCDSNQDCGAGQYCDPDLGGCRDFCADNSGCADDEFCDLNDPAGGICVTGCRDDADDLAPGANNDAASATPVILVNRHGEFHGKLVCPGNPDFFAVEMFQQARMQLTLTARDPNIGDVKVRIYDTDGMTQALENVQPGSPKRLRFPEDVGMGVPAPGTYYIEVFSDDPASQEYDLSVTLIDAIGDGACFPEDGEFDNNGRGHNISDDAIDLGWDGRGDEEYTFRGSVCGGDEDWFSFVSPSQEAGASIELIVDGLVGSAVIEMYNSVSVRNLGAPSFSSGPGVPGAGGTVTFRLDVPRDSASLPEDTWYIRVRGGDAGSLLDDYGLNIQLLRPRVGCEDDVAEPNGNPAEVTDAANLDLLPGIAARGLITRDADQEIPLDLRLCAREEDWFSFTAEDGDQIRVWGTSDGLAGNVELTIAGADGNDRGQPGALTAPGAQTSQAQLNGANAGTYYVRVRSVGAGTADPYVLFIHINATAMCGADVAEVGPGSERNDSSATSVLLMSVDPNSERFEYQSGLICNVGSNDLDWYRFHVAQDDTRVCVATEFEDLDGGDLNLEIFDCENDPADDVPCGAARDCSDAQVRASRLCLPAGVCGCNLDADCDIDNDGLSPEDGRCVAGRCKSALARSTTDGAPELVDLARGTVAIGDLCVLVSGVSGDENSYALNVTLNQRHPQCSPDWRETDQLNDGPDTAVYLGNAQGGVCDGWLCNNERGSGDWYDIDIPPGTGDRTVLVTYNENSDGRAVFLFQHEDAAGMMNFYERPFDTPPDVREECTNIHAGANGGHVFIGVQGDREQPADGDEQIDYTLRILPYDPAAHPNGRCEEFIGNPQDVWSFDL